MIQKKEYQLEHERTKKKPYAIVCIRPFNKQLH